MYASPTMRPFLLCFCLSFPLSPGADSVAIYLRKVCDKENAIANAREASDTSGNESCVVIYI